MQLDQRTLSLWSMVGCAAGLDYVTTRIGLMHGLPEVNPLAAASIDAVGLGTSVVLLKSPAVVLAALAYHRDLGGRPDLAPLALVALWTAASLLNIASVALEVVA